LAAVLLTIASLLTGIVACSGLYSLVAYSTMRRIPEFGLRLALGASRLQIVRLVIGEGLALSAGGVMAGVIVSALVVGLAAGVIPDMPRIGFATIGVIATIVAGIVAAACYGPARRAAAVDPLVSLRHL
jgi:putative ABC transport system permease protein